MQTKPIKKMNQDELIEMARILGAHSDETFEDSQERFEKEGREDLAITFSLMTARWWELEE